MSVLFVLVVALLLTGRMAGCQVTTGLHSAAAGRLFGPQCNAQKDSTLVKRIGIVVLGVTVLLAVLWATAMLVYAGPFEPPVRLWIALAWCILALFALGFAFAPTFRSKASIALIILALPVTGWWLSLTPSNERVWQPDVAAVAHAEIDGDQITLHNVRNFNYRTEQDFDPHWDTRTVRLSELRGIDLVAVYWGSDAIAHTMLSFVFDSGPITISIETRKEENEVYSALAGFFRRYELIYIVGDERDLIGVRGQVREPQEDVYLYRLITPPERARLLFLSYIDKINALAEQAEWYNTATTNCTTNVLLHARTYSDQLPRSWKVLLSGHFPEYLYELGGMGEAESFEQLKADAYINERIHEAWGKADFSNRIRSTGDS